MPDVTTQAHAALRSFLAPLSIHGASPQTLFAIAEEQTPKIVRALAAAEARATLLAHTLNPWETNGSVGGALHHLMSGSLAAYLWAVIPDPELIPVLAVEYEHATLPADHATLLRDAVLVVVLAALQDGAVFCHLRLAPDGVQVAVSLTTDRPGIAQTAESVERLQSALAPIGGTVAWKGSGEHWTVTVAVPMIEHAGKDATHVEESL